MLVDVLPLIEQNRLRSYLFEYDSTKTMINEENGTVLYLYGTLILAAHSIFEHTISLTLGLPLL